MMPDFQSFAEQGSFIGLLQQRIAAGTLPHALLISGEKGIGKRTLADLLAAAILCRNEKQRPCGECTSCQLLAGGGHPDLIVIQKGSSIAPQKDEKSKTVIPVSEIEELERRCAALPFEGENRVTIVCSAEDMNQAAQNKLLKTLEEPAPGNFFLLTCENREALLPTIVSRCESIYLHPWKRETVLEALRQAGIPTERAEAAADEARGSIGKALQLAGDESYWETRNDIYRSFFHLKEASGILTVSGQWKDRKQDAEMLFSQMETGILRLLNWRLNKNRASETEMKALYDPKWVRFAEKCELDAFSGLLDGIMLARKQYAASVNFQVIVEQILFLLMEADRKWST